MFWISSSRFLASSLLASASGPEPKRSLIPSNKPFFSFTSSCPTSSSSTSSFGSFFCSPSSAPSFGSSPSSGFFSPSSFFFFLKSPVTES
jgi:hypothetical protein